mgnify:CR=1 FL=1
MQHVLLLCIAFAGTFIQGQEGPLRGGLKDVEMTADDKAKAASSSAKHFKQHDHVPILLNKVGPYSNPHETYRYLHLPFCQGKQGSETEHKDMGHSLGELFTGDRKTTSNYDVTFRDDVAWRVLCSKTLDIKDIQLFRKAVEEEDYFEMFMDGLPMWGFVGDFHDDFVWHRESKSHHYIFTHLKFDIAYNINEKGKFHFFFFFF